VLCVEKIGKIRRRRLVHGESICAIAQDLGLSRNTVKRALRFEGKASSTDAATSHSAHVVNVLHRPAQPPAAPILQLPEALKLTVALAANCSRCDRLSQSHPIYSILREP
jgi:transposase-like protein